MLSFIARWWRRSGVGHQYYEVHRDPKRAREEAITYIAMGLEAAGNETMSYTESLLQAEWIVQQIENAARQQRASTYEVKDTDGRSGQCTSP